MKVYASEQKREMDLPVVGFCDGLPIVEYRIVPDLLPAEYIVAQPDRPFENCCRDNFAWDDSLEEEVYLPGCSCCAACANSSFGESFCGLSAAKWSI